MTATEVSDVRSAMARCLQPGSWRVVKVGTIWLVHDPERPGEYIRQVSFKTRKKAIEFAAANGQAVYKRLAEQLHQNCN